MAGGKIKQGTGKSRGYIGYHVTWDNKRVFLRSKAEFIYAKVLDAEQVPYMLECVTYTIDNKRYRPDFFIFDYNYQKIKKIIEIKGLDDKQTALRYLEMYKDYFNVIGIEYDVIWKYQASITRYNLHDDIEKWKQTSVNHYDHVSDVSGIHNPMYGIKHKQSTIDNIRKKALARQTTEYRQKNSEAQLAYWNTVQGKKRKLELSRERKARTAQENPIVTKQCKHCTKDFQDKLKSRKEFCSGQCKRKWSYANVPEYGKWRKKNG